MVLLLVLLGGSGAGIVSALQAPVYRASVQLFFSPNFATADIGQLNEGGNYILQRVRSYAEIANSPEIAAAVIDRLDLEYQPDQLMSAITVSGKAGTAVLNVEVRDAAPERARDIANAIAQELPGFIDRLEKPTGIDTSPVKVSVVRPATTPASPESPRVLTNIILGVLGGLFLGVTVAVVRYARDRTVRDESHAAEVAGSALVGVVAVGPRTPPLIVDDETSARSESFRQMRANLRLRAAGQPLTSVMVTGSAPGEGKTAVAANLAIAFARAGETVVLVDADLRDPGVHQVFAIPNTVGLANVLRQETSFNDAVRQWRPDLPLYLLPSGPVGAGPSEKLFQLGELAKVMDSLRLGNVFVIVVGPPLLSDAEAMLVANATDATVLVAGVAFTEADRLATAVDVLRAMQANLLGVVVVRQTRAVRATG